MTTTMRQDMVKAVDEAAVKLAHIRGCSKADALRAVAQTYAANLADSRTTTMESYWQRMVEVADDLAASARVGA